MYLLAVVLILIVWGIYGLYKAAQPSNPPFEDTEQMLKTIQSLPNPKARQKYLRDRARAAQQNIITKTGRSEDDTDGK